MPKTKHPKIVEKVLSCGAFMTDAGDTVKVLLDEGGDILYGSGVTDVFLFRAEDNRFYVATFECVVDEANTTYVAETLEENFARCPSCGHLQEIDNEDQIEDEGEEEDTKGECLCDKCKHICVKISKKEALKIAREGIKKRKSTAGRRRHVGLK
jgi:hypothetical protein